MNRSRVLGGLGGLSSLLGCVAVWFAFQRRMCTGTGECAPNVVYLVPGALALLVGVGLAVVAYRRTQTNEPVRR